MITLDRTTPCNSQPNKNWVHFLNDFFILGGPRESKAQDEK